MFAVVLKGYIVETLDSKDIYEIIENLDPMCRKYTLDIEFL